MTLQPPPIKDSLLTDQILSKVWIKWFIRLFKSVSSSADAEIMSSMIGAEVDTTQKLSELELQVVQEKGNESLSQKIAELEEKILLLCSQVDSSRVLADIELGSVINSVGSYTPPEVPHLMQSDSTDQAIADVGAAQVITFDTDVHHKGFIRTSPSRFTVQKAGSYLITFSGIVLSAVASTRIEVWLRLNGSDVANSNTVYTFKAANANTVIAVSFIEHFAVDDYFEFWTWGDNTGAKWDATAAAGTPDRPAAPSIIITCSFLSAD